ncbi:MAG: sigma-70 family RNA polymerase sigma factor [Lentisphaeria bacterium]|nr:sigma-70 family RNA polymerase sigma factor [Lentisphaeria bacterium]
MKELGQEIEDMVLIREYLSGKDESFTVLYGRYKSLLYSYLNRLLEGDRSRADDLFQQTWIRALDQLGRYEHRQQFSAWLLRIAHNLAIDYFRKCGRLSQYEAGSLDEPESALDLPGRNDEPWRGMHREELERAISEALKKLSPELREVFLLRRENVAFREIAQIQKCSINTVLARMQYALKNLRRYLADWEA